MFGSIASEGKGIFMFGEEDFLISIVESYEA